MNVARREWKAVVTPIDAATADWTRKLLSGADLASTMEAASADFDFTAWLTLALQSQWVQEIQVGID